MARKPPDDRLGKVRAVMADRAATDGEKAAAEAAAARIRSRVAREQAAATKAAIKENGPIYRLGRALGRARRESGDDTKPAGKGVMYALGKALKKATKAK